MSCVAARFSPRRREADRLSRSRLADPDAGDRYGTDEREWRQALNRQGPQASSTNMRPASTCCASGEDRLDRPPRQSSADRELPRPTGETV